MVVNEVDFKRALKSVSDICKIPWLYRIEAFFHGKDVFTSLPTGYGSDLQSSTDDCRWAVIFLDMSTSQIFQGNTLCRLFLRMARLVRARRWVSLTGKE